jgi:biopolymer transport protein TolR
MMIESQKNKKDLNFEINLVSFIDLLSVCISFLLITNAWTLLGAMELKQGTGTQALLSEQTPILVMSLNGQSLEIKVKNSKKNLSSVLNLQDPQVAKQASERVSQYQAQIVDLKSAIVLSSAQVPYRQIVSMLEILKTKGVTQVGLSSL